MMGEQLFIKVGKVVHSGEEFILVTYVALLNPTYSFPAIFFRKFMSCRNSNRNYGNIHLHRNYGNIH